MITRYEFGLNEYREPILQEIYEDISITRGFGDSLKFANLAAIVEELKYIKITENSPDIIIKTFYANTSYSKYRGVLYSTKSSRTTRVSVTIELLPPKHEIILNANKIRINVVGGYAIVDRILAEKHKIEAGDAISVKIYTPLSERRKNSLDNII